MMNIYAQYMKDKFDERYFDGKWKYEDIGWQDKAMTIKRLFNPNRVLDIGCAKGYLIRHLLELDIESIGIDISEYAVSSQKSRNLLVADASYIPFKDESFDFINATDVIEHLPEPEMMIIECHRILADCGKLYLETPHPVIQEGDSTHINVHPHDYWKKLLEKNGFNVEDYVISPGRYLNLFNMLHLENSFRTSIGHLFRKHKIRLLAKKV